MMFPWKITESLLMSAMTCRLVKCKAQGCARFIILVACGCENTFTYIKLLFKPLHPGIICLKIPNRCCSHLSLKMYDWIFIHCQSEDSCAHQIVT